MNIVDLTNERLKADLKNFGLNPKQWVLKKRTADECLLVHRRDQDFTIRGYIRSQGQTVQWQSLRLLSL